MIKYLAILLSLLFLPLTVIAASAPNVPLQKAHIDFNNKASLQRGAKLYMNYCAGCHSLKYVRYSQMAKDIGITDSQGKVYKDLVKDNLIFTGAKISDMINIAMTTAEAKQWFGVAPPDLSLVTRVRGVNWLYTYLISFYEDANRPWGANNLVFPDVAMPNVLENLQGTQIPIYKERVEIINGQPKKTKIINHLVITKEGSMDSLQFQSAVNDIVNFLAYTGEPVKLKRQHIGFWVLGFLILLVIILYFLKKEFWRDIHEPGEKE